MKYEKTALECVYHIIPEKKYDERGYFAETFNARHMFAEVSMWYSFITTQQNISDSFKGVFRGFHYQKEYPQAKIVMCMNGKILDFAVDVRPYSQNYMQHISVILDSEKRNMLYIPKGFAHGFLALENSLVSYLVDGEYRPELEAGVIYSKLGIDWQGIFDEYGIDKMIISEKDRKW